MTTPSGETVTGEGTGDGAVDALLQAINAATGIAGVLKEYHVAAVTADTDALGEVSVLVEHDGRLASGPERLDRHARGVRRAPTCGRCRTRSRASTPADAADPAKPSSTDLTAC